MDDDNFAEQSFFQSAQNSFSKYERVISPY